MSTILRGKAGAEDINFGLGSFPRMEGFSSKGIRMQVAAEDFRIEDLMTWYTATETEAAVAELWEAAWDVVTSAADALYDGGYIDNVTDWINDIMEDARGVGGDINDETEEEDTDSTDDRPDITPPPVVVLYIRHPVSVRPGTSAMLWIEGSGGVGPYSWDYVTDGSGGSLAVEADTSRCLYTAGAAEDTDKIIITDTNGVTATATIVVSDDAPEVSIYGPGTVCSGGHSIDLYAAGGASPHTWSYHEHITNSTFSFTQTTATFTSGTEAGQDTVQVMEDGGAIAFHEIEVVDCNGLDTSPVIHGETSCEKEEIVYLQCVGGETPFAWEISDNQSGAILTGLTRNPATGEISTRATPPSPWHRELEYTAGSTAGVTDTIKVTDDDGDSDIHLIAVREPSVPSRPIIYGMEAALVNQVILLKVYGGTPPYDWEILTNNSGADLSEYENDEDGENHYTSGGDGGTATVPVQDTVRVTDANGYTDEHTISVYSDEDDTPDPWPPSPPDWPPWWNEEYGYLDGNIAPQDAIDAGAQWRTSGGSWMDTDETVEHLPVGDVVTVQFKEIEGWVTPDSVDRTIEVGPNVASGVYDQTPDAVSYFSVDIAQASYYIGKAMKLTVIPRDVSANPVNLGATSVKVSVDAGTIDAKTTNGGFVRSAAATEKTLTIVGASDDIYFVWWPDGAVPANITITVELAADAATNGSDSVPVDAAADVNASLVSGDTYAPSTLFNDFKVQVEDGDGGRCEYFEGDIRLTPDVGTISLDGVAYTAFVTFSVGPTHNNRPDIYITGPGTVTITARIDEHVAKTDTQAIDETGITFEFGSLWTPTTDRGLMNDNVAFEVEIVAYQGALIATTYDLACHLFADIGAITGDVINIGDWTNGRVTVAPTVDWDGSQPVVTITITDDLTPANTGSRAFVTEDQALQHSEVTALSQSMQYGDSAGHGSAEAAFNAAKVEYDAENQYDGDNFIGIVSTRTLGKAEIHVVGSAIYDCGLGYGVALYSAALTNFDDSHHLFAEITFDNPAWVQNVWPKTDLIVGVTPVNYDVSGYSLANKWLYVTSAFTLHTVAAADILDDGVVLIDLARIKSDIVPGIPIQIQLRPNIATASGSYVSGTSKQSRIAIAKVEIHGY